MKKSFATALSKIQVQETEINQFKIEKESLQEEIQMLNEKIKTSNQHPEDKDLKQLRVDKEQLFQGVKLRDQRIVELEKQVSVMSEGLKH